MAQRRYVVVWVLWFCVICSANAEPVSIGKIRFLRKQVALRKRGLIVHSDGYPMNERQRGIFEPSAPPSLFPKLKATQATTCTYSLVHQFPVARLYRSQVATEWPRGIIKKLYGLGPDGLDRYIRLCRQHGLEAFWAMRMNDTHDASDGAHGLKRWRSNLWKQQHTDLLFAKRGTPMRYGRWSAMDYAQPKVREKVFQILQEVCQNYAIDGLLLDFFRHLPTFKTTGFGGIATADEVASLTDLFRRIRKMADKAGAARGRPILLAVRAPDSTEYAKSLGLDIEQWMTEGLIDIWVATGYFRLRDWSDVVRQGHRNGVRVWAGISDSRLVHRQNRNSLEIYRGRIANAWRAGVDGVFLFNFFYRPSSPQFKLLYEAGDPRTLVAKNKLYVAEGRGRFRAGFYLRNGDRFFTRPPTVSHNNPVTLKAAEPTFVPLDIADDVAGKKGRAASGVTLRIQTKSAGKKAALSVNFNGHKLAGGKSEGRWTLFSVSSRILRAGRNRVSLSGSAVVQDLQLHVQY